MYGFGTEDGNGNGNGVEAPFSFSYVTGGATLAGGAGLGAVGAHLMDQNKLLGAGLGLLLGAVVVGVVNHQATGQILPLSDEDLRYARDRYDACVASVDAELGRLLERLAAFFHR